MILINDLIINCQINKIPFSKKINPKTFKENEINSNLIEFVLKFIKNERNQSIYIYKERYIEIIANPNKNTYQKYREVGYIEQVLFIGI